MTAIKTDIEPSLVQRVRDGARYVLTGTKPNSWFSPGQPLSPVAQNPNQGAIGRQFDYQPSVNIQLQPKQQEAGITYSQLRDLSYSLPILRTVIETRKDQIEKFEFDIVAREDASISDVEIDAIKKKILQPTPEYDFSGWMRILLEDLFVIDAVAIYPRKTNGGGLYSLDLVDGATIKRVVDDGGRTPMMPDPAYQQILKGVPAVDYTVDDMIFRCRNPRSSRMYGYSPVEQILMTINIALRREQTQLNHFTEGNVPEVFISTPDSWNPDQLSQFEMYFNSKMQGNLENRSRAVFVPLDASKIKEMRDPDLKGAFDEWLARIVCYAFSVPAAPFIKEMNRSTADSAKTAAMEEGLMPILNWIKRLMDFIIRKHMGEDRVEFKWRMSADIDPVNQANIDKIYIEAGVRTVNEVRQDRGWEVMEIQKA